ncbi:MAG: hypothetical protein RLZZ333_1683, partial [Bacteroidota bacterium]
LENQVFISAIYLPAVWGLSRSSKIIYSGSGTQLILYNQKTLL